MSWWNNLSVSKKLYCVVGAMGLLIALELFTLIFAMNTLSSVRAFVAGEGLWSKAQKDSITSLQKYVVTQDEKYYKRFQEFIKVPMGDHNARIEMEKSDMNLEAVQEGFLAGKNHPDDILGMVKLIRRFGSFSYLAAAMEHWREADRLLKELITVAEKMHEKMNTNHVFNQSEIHDLLDEISVLNTRLTMAEDGFSYRIGVASRWLEKFLLTILVLSIVTIEGTGLYLTVSFSRNLSKVLKELNDATLRVGKGSFNLTVPVRSGDELGQLAISINSMIENLREQDLAVNMRDEFVSIASHELKTPLTSLKLQTQMRKRHLEKGDNSTFDLDKIRRMTDEDEKQLNRLIRIVDDMLDISRIRSGKFELILEKTNLVEIVEDTISRMLPQFEAEDTSINLIKPKELYGHWDPFRIEQVIINLLSNALKYGRNSPVTVKLDVQELHAVVSVSENGVGIPHDDKERIFDQFERALSSRETTGLGLGLYIVKNIVTAHNGKIEVTSEVDKGTTFFIYLPIGAVEAVPS